ncbi:hypothetical protein [Halocynthiibacter namhaensis]|uniref:hypothetical protein n=1 Tax=Halocynthiibacter namhaensis TaxID=1290553 RepID=UPI0005794A07|nr:hypothetical protein [Halocynthiibacter namhaensis]
MTNTEIGSIIKSCDQSLTVFLGGAGMAGGYNEEFMTVFREAGICNPVYGNYSGFGWTDTGGNVDMGGDAAAVILFNDMNILREIYHWDGERWLYKMGPNEEHWAPLEEHPQLMRIAQNGNYSLPEIGVSDPIPRKQDTFNFVGYSWGGVIACLSARLHALAGHEVDTLALIGAPVNPSLLNWVREMPNIKNVIVKNLTEFGDPIYAGMSDASLMGCVPELATSMATKPPGGHFYYSGSNTAESIQRKRNLVQILVSQGLS